MRKKFKRLVLIALPDQGHYFLPNSDLTDSGTNVIKNISSLLVLETKNDHPLLEGNICIIDKDFSDRNSVKFRKCALTLQNFLENSRHEVVRTQYNYIQSMLKLDCETLILFTNQEHFSMIIVQTADELQPNIKNQAYFRNMHCFLIETKKPLRIFANLF